MKRPAANATAAGCGWDIEVRRFRITLEKVGPSRRTNCATRRNSSVEASPSKATYPNGRGERIRAYTPSPSLLIPVANIPSYVGRVWKTA